jgi:hypothetical protein
MLAAFSEHPTIVLKKVLILEVKASQKKKRGLLSILYKASFFDRFVLQQHKHWSKTEKQLIFYEKIRKEK